GLPPPRRPARDVLMRTRGFETARRALVHRTLAWLAATLAAGCTGSQRLALEPIPAQDDDRYDIPAPQVRDRDDDYDFADYPFFKGLERACDRPRDGRRLVGRPKQAMNATPLDEVQDSSWFTNRLGARIVTPDEIRRGANRPEGPDMEHEWTIVAGKTQ